MEELDYWDDRLVVFKVVQTVINGRRNAEVKGRSLVEGVERYVAEIIELDDD